MNTQDKTTQRASAPETRQEQYQGCYINELSDGRFHVVKNGVELTNTAEAWAARAWIDEHNTSSTPNQNQWLKAAEK